MGWRRGLLLFALSWASALHAEQIFRNGMEGYASCVNAGGDTLDVPFVSITPEFRLNGAAFPLDNTRYARLYLANEDGYQVFLGTTYAALPPAVRVIPGVYDVVYEYITGDGIPINHGAHLQRNLWIGADGTLQVDVPGIVVTGDFRHNGAAFPIEASNSGNLFLDPIYYGGEVVLGPTWQQQSEFVVLPGAYSLVYRYGSGTAVPANVNARLDRHDLDASGMHVFDVPSVLVNVTFQLNGGEFPDSAYERGMFSLGGAAGDHADLADSLATTAQRRVVPGTYDVHYSRIAGGNIVPRNDDAIVAGPFDFSGAGSVFANVVTNDVSGAFSINGAAPPASVYETGDVFVVDPSTGAKTVIGATHEQAYEARLVAQHYAIGYRHVAGGGGTAPFNPDTVIVADWNAVADTSRDIDIGAGTFSGSLSLNGGAFPGSVFDSGSMYLQPTGGGPPTLLGRTHYGSFDQKVIPGSYVVAYQHDAGATVPRNEYATLGGKKSIVADSGGLIIPVDIDVASVELARGLSLNGGAFPGADNAYFYLRHRHVYGDDQAYWGQSTFGSLSTNIVPGRYELIYAHSSGGSIPQNNYQRIACWDVPGG